MTTSCDSTQAGWDMEFRKQNFGYTTMLFTEAEAWARLNATLRVFGIDGHVEGVAPACEYRICGHAWFSYLIRQNPDGFLFGDID